jgi:hypothetical protein
MAVLSRASFAAPLQGYIKLKFDNPAGIILGDELTVTKPDGTTLTGLITQLLPFGRATFQVGACSKVSGMLLLPKGSTVAVVRDPIGAITLSPTTQARSTAFTLIVISAGALFKSGDVIRLNGVAVSTTFTDTGHVQTAISASQFTVASTVEVTVWSADGIIRSNQAFLTIT